MSILASGYISGRRLIILKSAALIVCHEQSYVFGNVTGGSTHAQHFGLDMLTMPPSFFVSTTTTTTTIILQLEIFKILV